MQGRDTWLALQNHLAAARAAAATGDRELALAEVAAALEIDPNFLAAQTLRERLANDRGPTVARASAVPDASTPPPESKPPRDVSPESYAKFQQRAKRRRVETRVEAARESIKRRQLQEAAAALDELRELAPEYYELPVLAAEFDALRRRAATSHRGRWVAAAAAFIATTLGASYVQDSSWLISRPLITAGTLMPAAESRLAAAPNAQPVGTVGEIEGVAAPAPAPAGVIATDLERPSIDPVRTPPAAQPASLHLAAPAEPLALTVPAQQLPPPPQAPPPQTLAYVAPAYVPPTYVAPPAPVSAPPVRQEPVVDDSALVQKALQRYRHAYEELDAQSAQAVWPAVNGAALARAFDGLESQTLTFDACDVRVDGEAATATCRGSARYVPKVGSREPRVEPRMWNFRLRKTAGDWTIDSARAQR